MINLKFLRSLFLNGAKQALALIHVHIGNARVKAESVVSGTQRPDVYVVDFLHALHGEDGASDFFDAHLSGAAFQENVGRLAENADAGPEDEKADGDAEERVDPEGAGHSNGDSAGDDGDIREGVAEIVHQDATEV